MNSSGRWCPLQGERVRFVRHQQAINATHPLPVILIGSSADKTDLIVPATVVESWPSKLMGAQVVKESLQEIHVFCSLPRVRLGGATGSERWRVKRFDYYTATLSTYGSAAQVQVTA